MLLASLDKRSSVVVTSGINSNRNGQPSLASQISYAMPMKRTRSVCSSIIKKRKSYYGKIQTDFLDREKPKHEQLRLEMGENMHPEVTQPRNLEIEYYLDEEVSSSEEMKEDENCRDDEDAAFEQSSSSSSEDGETNHNLMKLPRMTATVSAQPELRGNLRSQSSEDFTLSLKQRVSVYLLAGLRA